MILLYCCTLSVTMVHRRHFEVFESGREDIPSRIASRSGRGATQHFMQHLQYARLMISPAARFSYYCTTGRVRHHEIATGPHVLCYSGSTALRLYCSTIILILFILYSYALMVDLTVDLTYDRHYCTRMLSW